MSTNILLVPIQLDAFYTDGTTELAAPLADFTKLPYYSYDPPSGLATQPKAGLLTRLKCMVGMAVPPPPPPPPPKGGGVNGDHTFLSDTVFRSPNPSFKGSDDTWTPQKGLHLHWALPDALTASRKDPKSDGKSRFPQVPNRWMVVLSTKSGANWTEQNAWVVESDYLYPDPKTNPKSCGINAISFPIAPPEVFQQLLDTPVPPPEHNPSTQDVTNYPFYYQAPFRCMGRNEPLKTWQGDTNQNEYLPQYNPAGLTAVGYGHPLFAAIYSNCFSVFGFHDDLSSGSYPRRYDLIGWYDDEDTDCLTLFQNLAPGTSAWDALKAEYNWASTDESGNLPTQSVYYSRLEMNAPLTGSMPSGTSTLTVGNTATEALSAYLSQTLQSDPADQLIVEEQLEAMGLHPKLGVEDVDLGAKFREARHDKGFKKVNGGSLWSVRAKSTTTSASTPTQDQNSEVTLPDGLAHLLNKVNILQAGYDASWDNINSLRRRAFADWYRLEYQRVTEHTTGPQLPSINDILAYSQDSVLKPMQELAAATGQINYSTDNTGKATITVEDTGRQYDLTVQFSIAQQLLQAINNLSQQLGFYNAGKAAQAAKLEYYLIRKGAPRFYAPTDPAVLLDGDALVMSNRYGNSETLECGLCAVTEIKNSLTDTLRSNGLSSGGAFSTILDAIDKQIQGNGLGFKSQSSQPWHPVSLEWSSQVWPEKRNTSVGLAGEGIQYGADFVSGTYEVDVDATDLKIKEKPYGLANPETPYDYTGRVVLVSHAPDNMQNSIKGYLMPLTLQNLKTGGIRSQVIDDETDYQYDLQLFTWANTIFGIAKPPFLGNLKDPSTLTPSEITQQKNEIATWMAMQYPFVKEVNNKKELIDLGTLASTHVDWYDVRPVILDGAKLGQFSALLESEQAKDPLVTAVNAYNTLTGKSLLSQALSGFNDALLTQEREFQLPVWDWRVINIEEQKSYTRDLARNLDGIHTAPVFDGAFLPIRSGVMQVSGLTVVDSFGQYLPLNYGGPSATKKSERMTILSNVAASVSTPSNIATTAENQNYLYLPPRVTQETRLNFRWLAADMGNASGIGDEPEMNDHPATTPVCGWVLPNNLDGSLAIYSADGSALGSLVQSDIGGTFSVVWESAPGTNNYTPVSKLPNPHLYDFVSNIITWGSGSKSTWQDFLSNINTALQNIDPKSFAQHPALSLLMGRPIALVRTSLQIQTKGYPDIDQTVEAFNYDQNNNLFTRLTNGFDKVTIPIRLGEAKQLNDGLVAYFVEDGQGGFTPGPNSLAHFPELEQIGAVADTLSLTLSDDPMKLTMLVDPRGSVHATCGFLPTKQISIPPDQFAKVLSTMSVTFLTSPVITTKQSVKYPLPAEAGYGWSWLDRPTGFTWNRVADIQNTSREAIYEQQRILEGWLKLSPQTEKEIN